LSCSTTVALVLSSIPEWILRASVRDTDVLDEEVGNNEAARLMVNVACFHDGA
jgi:hypothetical protein